MDFGSLPTSQQTLVTKVFFLMTRLGHEVVLFFFVLSGFLVGGKVIERLANQTFKVGDYAMDRAVRILLPLISSLLLYLPICWYCGISVNPLVWIGNILSLQGIVCGPVFETLWSLSYEVWFYILMGALAVFLTNRGVKSSKGAGLLLIVSAIVFIKLDAYYLYIWMIGALVYWRMPKQNLVVLFLTLVASVAALLMLQLTSDSHSGGIEVSKLIRNIIELLFGVIFAMLLIQVIQTPPKSKTGKAIDRLGSKLAAFSYTLYLTHIPVRDLLWHLGAPKSEELSIESIGLYILWVLLALVIAYAVYYCFERNTAVVKKYLKSKFIGS